jgi:1-deoxyxylulose-5-phosphate synthase
MLGACHFLYSGRDIANRRYAMKTRVLGSTGIAISRVALGCGSFGGIGSPKELVGRGLDEAESFATMDEAVALGINLFDTAHAYAQGASEKMLGRWLAAQPSIIRADIHLSTKVGLVITNGGRTVDLSPTCIAQQLNISLERLGIDRVDFCLSHFPDTAAPIEETLEGFAAVIEAGKAMHIGACNLSATQLSEAIAASVRLGLPRYECIQNEYNLLKRKDESDVFAICREHELGLTPYSPMAGGILTGKYIRDQVPPSRSRVTQWPGSRLPSPKQFDAIAQLSEEAAKLGISTGAMALAWVIAHPLVVAPLVGPSRTSEHLQAAREALTIELDDETRRKISSCFD